MIASFGILTIATSCERSAPTPPPTAESDETGSVETDSRPLRRGYEVPIPSIEFWDASNTVPKYYYEMRFEAPRTAGGAPRLHRNGWSRAFYGNGALQREGAYRYDPSVDRSERVGRWTYYEIDGTVERVEERGGPTIWTEADQLIAPPDAPNR